MTKSKYGKPHGEQIHLAMSGKVTDEVQAARDHVASCADCLHQLSKVFRTLHEIGFRSGPSDGHLSSGALAARFRRRAEKLLVREHKEQPVEDEHARWLRQLLRNPHGSAEYAQAEIHVDVCAECQHRLELGEETIAKAVGLPLRRAPRQKEEKE